MKKILFVHAVQFGYHIDTLYYCKHLKGEYDITYISWDYGNERIVEEGVRTVYVPRTGMKVSRLARLLTTVLKEMRVGGYDLTFLVYFRFCSLIGLFGSCGAIVMDVRTGWILPGWLQKQAFNTGILVESFAFRYVSVITEELRAKLRLPRSKCHILPLGAEIWEMGPKNFEGMHLLYVGTFQNRHIYKTVLGFDAFAEEMAGKIPLSYDIIGKGTAAENEHMVATIAAAKNSSLIRYHGRIPHNKLPPYFAAANIGVAFVPLIDAQAPQPYTKVYEYLQAGMPVLATENPSNLKIIDADNGALCVDTPEGCLAALREMYRKLSLYDSIKIRKESSRFAWSTIVRANLKPYLERVHADVHD
jgi:glycosyltransferase involved in cell wall biosynthesis